MAKKSISISVDEETKDQASELFADMGLDMSTACNVFLRKCVQQGSMPFELSASNMVNGGMDFFNEWACIDVLEYDSMKRYLEQHNINPRELRSIDFVRILDAMSCVAGQCGLFKDDNSAVWSLWNLMMSGKKFPLGGKPEVEVVPYDPAEYVNNRYVLKIPASRHKNMVDYVASPYTSYLLDYVLPRDKWPEDNQASAMMAMSCLHLMSGYLETAAYEAEKAQGGYGGFWEGILLGETYRIEKVLGRPMSNEELLDELDCAELHARYTKALQSAPNHPFKDKYGHLAVCLACDKILENGYRKYAEENTDQLKAEAEAEYQEAMAAAAVAEASCDGKRTHSITQNAESRNFINAIAIEMCASQSSAEVFAIICKEMGYIPH